MSKAIEVGVVSAHPVVWMYRMCQTIFRTWMHARRQGLPCDLWYGVYEAGSETALAHMGSLPGAEDRAQKLVAVIAEEEAKEKADV